MLPKYLWSKRIAVWDLETDFIPTSIIYMNGVSIIEIDDTGVPTITPSRVFTYKWTHYSTGSLYESIKLVNTCDYHCGHNLVSFDMDQIRRHLNTAITAIPLDTMIIAKLMFSSDELYAIDRQLGLDAPAKPFSLDSFGKRLGDHKIEFHEFDEMTEEMAIYCNQDVDLTVRLLLHLLAQDNLPNWDVIALEHKVAGIIQEQQNYGFYFDIDKGRALNTVLLTEKHQIASELATMFAPKFLKDGKEKKYKGTTKTRKFLPNPHYQPLLGTKL